MFKARVIFAIFMLINLRIKYRTYKLLNLRYMICEHNRRLKEREKKREL